MLNIQRTTLFTARKAQDLEVHVQRTAFADVEVLEFADYIVSAQEYGRRYWLPIEQVVDLLLSIAERVEEVNQ